MKLPISVIRMRPFRYVVKRNFFSLRSKPAQLPRAGAPLPQDKLIDEEVCPAYNSKHFYPAKPGEILGNRYQILVKIGWGSRSTVWLARDVRRYKWQSERIVALKINNHNSQKANANHERDIEEHISKTNPSHLGYPIVRTCLESFDVMGPEGRHECLAYEPMREPFWLFQRRFKDQRIPLRLVKAYILILLAGLDYLHSECKVVHTDLKLENILVTFESESIIKDFIKTQTETPMQYKTDHTGRTVYRRHNDFGPLRQLKNVPKIVDFGASLRLDDPDDFGIHPIQPNHYRAPEVILGCGWTFSADIWNLGVLVWDIIEGTELFRQVHDTQGQYDSAAHLAEMIALLGPPPTKLLAKSDAVLQWKRRPGPDKNEEEGNIVSRNMRQYFGGPFFDKEGKFRYEHLIPTRKLKDTLPSLETEEERDNCLSFVSEMLTWLPEERKTARELMEHPFLDLTNVKNS